MRGWGARHSVAPMQAAKDAKPEVDFDALILAGVAHPGLAAGNLPEKIKILNWGVNQTAFGDIEVNDLTLSAIEAQRDADTYRRIVIDFEHQSERNSKNFVPSPRLHAGYGDAICLAGDGLYVEKVAYTPAGKKYAPEYADVSGAVSLIKGTRVVGGLRSVALCPNGAARDMVFLSGDEAYVCATGVCRLQVKDAVFLRGDEAPGSEVVTLATDGDHERAKLIEQISALNEALKALASDLKTVKDENTLLRDSNKNLIEELQNRVTTLSAESSAAVASAERSERLLLLDGAKRDGKILPLSADQCAALPIDDLREIVGRAKAGVVPLVPKTPLVVEEKHTNQKSEISRMLGVTE